MIDQILLNQEDEHLREQVTDFFAGYARIGNRFLHHFILPNKGLRNPVDHVNQNKLDNRRSNLRHVTRTQNAMNSKNFSSNTSGVRGISWKTREHIWEAYGKRNQITTHLYRGSDFFLACCARKAWELTL